MKILFLSLGEFDDLSSSSVHIDLIKRFSKEHNVYLVCKRERRQKRKTELTVEYGINVLRVKTGNIKRTNLIEKGVSTILVETQFLSAIKKYFSVTFDLILYETPPITFGKVVKTIKKRDNAKSYLMLKDIFPQNGIDIGILSKRGLKGIIYRYFRKKEIELYKYSDYIGCMSEANVKYILDHNGEIDRNRVEVCPNSINARDMSIGIERNIIRNKFGIPTDKVVFVYGGNLGKPQGISFLIECLKAVNENQKEDVHGLLTHAYFLIIGSGTEYPSIQSFIKNDNPQNVRLMPSLPGNDYNAMVGSCDVGLLFLDHRFTIPNFPSRMLSYMQAKMPILSVTDPNTDVGKVITDGGFGWWCESNDVSAVIDIIKDVIKDANSGNLNKKGMLGWNYLNKYYSVDVAYDIIMKHLL